MKIFAHVARIFLTSIFHPPSKTLMLVPSLCLSNNFESINIGSLNQYVWRVSPKYCIRLLVFAYMPKHHLVAFLLNTHFEKNIIQKIAKYNVLAHFIDVGPTECIQNRESFYFYARKLF